MPSTQTWGRKESWIWPPRGFYYTYGAFFIAAVLCGFFMYLRFQFGMSALQRYYLPYSIRTWTAGWRQSTGQYQLLYVAGPGRQPRVALDSDAQSGETRQPGQRPLPVQLSGAARSAGYTTLFREAPRAYQNRGLSLFLQHWIYDDAELFSYFRAPILFGLLALLIQLPFSLRKDIARRKQLRYGRRLKGPILVAPKEFTKQLAGDGIGLQVEGQKALLRIPREAENTHFLIVGDTGSGKSTIIRSILCQVAERGHSAIVYDPACEFVRQFYTPDRGDIVLNPLDERCPYWSPSAELQRKAEAKALAVSLFQPSGNTLKFFVESSLICSRICRRRPSWFTGCRTRRKSTAASKTPSSPPSLTRKPRSNEPACLAPSIWLPTVSVCCRPKLKVTASGPRLSGPRNARDGSSSPRAQRCARRSGLLSVCGSTSWFCAC
jgi:hypothetical protein